MDAIDKNAVARPDPSCGLAPGVHNSVTQRSIMSWAAIFLTSRSLRILVRCMRRVLRVRTTFEPTRCILARRLDWASLLERVFGPDVTECPRCGDRLRVLAFITDPDATTRILAHLGLPAATPTVAPARAPPETSFDVTA
jgi:hypothetical protein